MIFDHVIILQAALSAGIMWCACQERNQPWYRAGFVLMACSSGFMVWRRVTARADVYLDLDRVVLPMLITWVMAAATICFVLHHLVGPHDRERLSTPRAFAPFLLFFLVTGTDVLPAQATWNGRNVAVLSSEAVRTAALYGPNVPAACEQLRWQIDTDLDTLRLVAMGNGEGAEFARRKLLAISKKAALIPVNLPEPAKR